MKKQIAFYCLCLLGILNGYAQHADSVFQQAVTLYEQNNYSLAQEKYLRVLKQAETENNTILIIKAQQGIAMCHYYLRDKKTALKWLYHSLASTQKYQLDTLLSDVYYKIGIMYIETGRVDSAEYYSHKAADLYRNEKKYDKLSQALSALSDVYLNSTKDFDKAESTIKEAAYYANLSKDKNCIAFANMKWYFLYTLLKKDYQKALPYITNAEKYYTESGNKEGIMYAYNFKAECLAMLGDTLAASYMHKWFAWKDSVFNLEKATGMAKYETLYETEKKEQENKLLQKQNELNNLVLLIVMIIFLLLVALGLWLFNRNNLKKKQHEIVMLQNLQKEKERIARDLHDHVGGQLSYIIYSLDGLHNESEEKRGKVTESINQSVRSVISSLRETIWAISDANIQVQDFSDKLKMFVRSLFKHSNTKINFTEDIQNERELNALLGLNLYRICQEILNNAFKYASATEVNVDMQSGENIIITLSDNGIGLDAAPTLKEQELEVHYGLQNIRKRAEEFGISLTLYSIKGKGTEYMLVV